MVSYAALKSMNRWCVVMLNWLHFSKIWCSAKSKFFQFSFSTSHRNLPYYWSETFHPLWWIGLIPPVCLLTHLPSTPYRQNLLIFLFIASLNSISLVISFLHYSFTTTRVSSLSVILCFLFIYLFSVYRRRFEWSRLILCSVYVTTVARRSILRWVSFLTLL
jgi:hypothetical protein